jgi:5-oxoprolinase (ATP-hydrolysing)
MQDAVRFQVAHWKGDLTPGDVLVTNHPVAGGTHLPDITVITPVFAPSKSEGIPLQPVFFVASRGHHADIGGIAPGSMPPHSTLLEQEGAAIVAFKLVKGGVFQEDVCDLFLAPAKVEGSSGSRRLSENISDLQAQVKKRGGEGG